MWRSLTTVEPSSADNFKLPTHRTLSSPTSRPRRRSLTTRRRALRRASLHERVRALGTGTRVVEGEIPAVEQGAREVVTALCLSSCLSPESAQRLRKLRRALDHSVERAVQKREVTGSTRGVARSLGSVPPNFTHHGTCTSCVRLGQGLCVVGQERARQRRPEPDGGRQCRGPRGRGERWARSQLGDRRASLFLCSPLL